MVDAELAQLANTFYNSLDSIQRRLDAEYEAGGMSEKDYKRDLELIENATCRIEMEELHGETQEE